MTNVTSVKYSCYNNVEKICSLAS
uniref:Uncharacterized protein n=1 Tax=Anguilla anguilla TaxID=7936 RepID=A0A0E9RPK8_ANGAN